MNGNTSVPSWQYENTHEDNNNISAEWGAYTEQLQGMNATSSTSSLLLQKLLYEEDLFSSTLPQSKINILLCEHQRLTMKSAQTVLQPINTQNSLNQPKKPPLKDPNQKKVWDNLYEKGLEQKKVKELLEKTRKENETQVLFQPTLIADNSQFNVKRNFQERNKTWKDMKNKKIEDARRTLNESADRIVKEQCTFAPHIIERPRDSIVQPKNKQIEINPSSNQSNESQQSSTQSTLHTNSSTQSSTVLSAAAFQAKKSQLHKYLQELSIDL